MTLFMSFTAHQHLFHSIDEHTVRQTVHPFTDTHYSYDATSIGAFEFVHTRSDQISFLCATHQWPLPVGPPPLQQVSQNGSVALERKTVGASLGERSQSTFTNSGGPSAYRTRIRISCLDRCPRPAFGLLTLRIVPGLVCRLTLWDRLQPLRRLVLSCSGPVRVPASFLQLHTGTQ
ncbi:hypothetical protein CI102_6744 [Trichoderma harzianum]|nr:hypothetical protein CI102_6744 [Trichoderma harzianum]